MTLLKWLQVMALVAIGGARGNRSAKMPKTYKIC